MHRVEESIFEHSSDPNIEELFHLEMTHNVYTTMSVVPLSLSRLTLRERKPREKNSLEHPISRISFASCTTD